MGRHRMQTNGRLRRRIWGRVAVFPPDGHAGQPFRLVCPLGQEFGGVETPAIERLSLRTGRHRGG